VSTAFPQLYTEVEFVPGTWTDISPFVNGFTISRPSTRLQGPLISWQPATLSLLLDNCDGRFDPDNLAGPYTQTSGLQAIVRTFPVGAVNWTAPLNLSGTTIKVETWAGGGGGSGTGFGAGGAEYAADPAVVVTAGSAYAGSSGAGGFPGVGVSNPGTDGASSFFTGDAVTITAHGGKANGTGGTGSTAAVHSNGGAGGAAPTTASPGDGGGGGASGGPGGPGNAGAAGNSGGAGGPAAPGSGPGGNGTTGNGQAPKAGPGGAGSGTGFGRGNLAFGGGGQNGQVRLTYLVVVPSGTVTQLNAMVPIRVRGLYTTTPADGTFETTLAGWTPNGCTHALSAAHANSGTHSDLLTVTGSPVQAFDGAMASVTGNAAYLTTFAAFSVAGISGVSPAIDWYDPALTYISTSAPAPAAIAAATWTPFTFTATSPANAAFARYRPSLGGSPANGTQLFIDDVTFSSQLFFGYADGWVDPAADAGGEYDQMTVSATDAFKVLEGIVLPPESPAGANDDSGARVNRILAAAGWDPSMQLVDVGDSEQQATTLGGSALSLLQLTSDTEIGSLYQDGAGNIVFRHRQALLEDVSSTTPQAVFGDLPGTVQAAGTELAFRSAARARDDTTLANDIQITRVGGTLQEAQDIVSQYQYLFVRSYVRTDVLLTTDTEAMNYALFVLYVSKDALGRLDQLNIDPVADPGNLYPQLLGRDMGDRIQTWRRPPGVSSPITKDSFIRGVTITYDSPTQAMGLTWDLQPADKYGAFLTLDSATAGRLDFNALAY
jgi:hypothetical protein